MSSTCLGFIGGLSPMHMMVVVFVALLLFGNKLPSVMRSLGEGFVEFKRAIGGISEETPRRFPRERDEEKGI